MVAIQRGTERPNDVVIITGPHRQPGDRRHERHRRCAGRQRRRLGHRGGDRSGARPLQAQVPGDDRLCRAVGRGAGAVRRQGARQLCQGAGLERRHRSSTTTSSATAAASDGVCDSTHARVLSEGPRSQGQAELAAATHSLGGENDAPSRNISRFLDSLADRLNIGLDVRQIWRTDRFGRGGDHIPFLELGYPAARISVAVENYNWQHQDLRTENGIRYGDTIDHVDFAYLAKMTKLNIAALAGDRQRSAAARAKGRRRGEHRHDADVARRAGRSLLRGPLAADGCQPVGSRRAQSGRRTAAGLVVAGRIGSDLRSCCPTSALTIGCSASRRSARTGSRARSPRRYRAARSSPMSPRPKK